MRTILSGRRFTNSLTSLMTMGACSILGVNSLPRVSSVSEGKSLILHPSYPSFPLHTSASVCSI